MDYPRDDISLRPLLKDVKRYNWNVFSKDLWAGLAVSFLSIPQALAYSIVIGLPPYCGLMTTIFGTACAAIFGSSRHLVVGPNNTTVLLVQTATANILFTYYATLTPAAQDMIAIQITAALLLLIGIFQILSGVLKLGRVIQFVSFPVVVGYVVGASFAIAAEQLFTFLNIMPTQNFASLFEKLRFLVMHVQEAHLPTVLVGVLSLTMMLTIKKLRFKIPTSLTMLIIITPLVYLLQLKSLPDQAGRVLRVIGDEAVVEAVIPSLQLPLFELRLLNTIVPIAFAIALISMLETTSISKSVAAHSGQRIHINQEIFGLGSANFVLSFLGALPCSGSISRTNTNFESGGITRFAAVYSGVFVAISVALFGKYIQYIPLAALAAVIVATAMRVVDRRQLQLCMKATHSDAFVLITTFLGCIFFSLQIAFYIGVILSIVLYLRKAAVPKFVEYIYDEEDDELRPMLDVERNLKHKIRIVNIEGELFFGAVDLFQSAMKSLAEGGEETKVFILRLKHVRDIDATVVTALKQFHDFLRKNGKFLLIASIPPSVYHVLENSGFVEYMGKANLFLYDEKNPHKTIEEALNRASELIQASSPEGE